MQDVVRASQELERTFSESPLGQILSLLRTSGLVYRNRRRRYSLAVPLLDYFIQRQL